MNKKQALKMIQKLLNDIHSQFLEIGRLLLALHEDGINIKTVCSDLDGLSYRKACHLIKIARVQSIMNLADEDIRHFGWTKMALIAPHLGDGNDEELMNLAKHSTAKELQMHLQGEGYGRLRAVVLLLSPEEAAELDKIALHYGALRHGKGLRLRERAIMSLLRQATDRVEIKAA